MAERQAQPDPALPPAAPHRPTLILGSASPARATLLGNAGITPIIWPSRVDEDALIEAVGETPVQPTTAR